MKKLLSFLSCLLIVLQLSAQDKKPEITFEETTFNFGTFPESKGKVTTEFKFTNTGNAPLLITRSAASCGCTTPEYPKEPIAPGKSGIIKVTYNAKGRPGQFQKSVYVYANTDPEKNTLIIRGNVESEAATPELLYKKNVGLLKVKSKNISFFDVYPTVNKSENFVLYNPTDKPVDVAFYDVPKHLAISVEPKIIPAKGEAKVNITYYAGKIKDWGLRKDSFSVMTNKQKSQDANITVSADIREDFSLLTDEQREKAPVISLSETLIDFGPVNGKQMKTINIKNSGSAPLIIRKIKSDNTAYALDLSKDVIEPGKSADLKITCNSSSSSKAKLNNNITVISNDPEQSIKVVRVRGEVK